MLNPGEPQKPCGAYFLWLMSHREKIKATLPADAENNRKQVAVACSTAWKALPDDKKKKWRDKNKKVQEEYEAYKSQGGVVTPGAYAKAKARKRRSTSEAAATSLLASLAACSDDEILAEIQRRFAKGARHQGNGAHQSSYAGNARTPKANLSIKGDC